MALEFRDGDSLVIQANLPGIDPGQEIEIWISHDVLHIRASTPAGEDPGGHGSDLRYGSFTRDIALPAGTDEHQVSATYRQGQLEIRAPFAHPPLPAEVRIPVVVLDGRAASTAPASPPAPAGGEDPTRAIAGSLQGLPPDAAVEHDRELYCPRPPR